jgi:exodeoxyribonuclease III
VRIATYNVNGVNGRLPRLLEWLAETRPEVACLQEIKTSNATVPAAAIEAAGYHALWHGQPRHHGVALLVRADQPKPVEVGRALPGEAADVQPRYLEARVGGLTVASVYLPNGNPQPGPKFDYKLAWLERLTTHAQALLASGQDAVLAGDFNVVPTDADIYDPVAWRFDAVLQPQTRSAWQRLLNQGWIDATRALYPAQRIYTFWVNRFAFERDAGFRMDFLLLSPSLRERLVATGVDHQHRGRERASDHAPVWVELSAGPFLRN